MDIKMLRRKLVTPARSMMILALIFFSGGHAFAEVKIESHDRDGRYYDVIVSGVKPGESVNCYALDKGGTPKAMSYSFSKGKYTKVTIDSGSHADKITAFECEPRK
mgnify:FL=1